METVSQEILQIVQGALLAALLAIIELARRTLMAWVARQTVIGAVQRGAGLALELERGGANPMSAQIAGEKYVEQAVPKALDATGAGTHLNDMVRGAVGVLRASGAPRSP